MTDQTPAYYLVIYKADDWTGGPLISSATWAKTPEEASHRVTNARQGRDALNTVGPFTDQTEAESYRRTWARDQGKRTIATLMDETASVIHTNSLRDRPDRTPAQNAALPPVVNLYQAFNIVAGGTGPDDTRGTRNGVNSADLVRTFNAFLNQGSALEWSQAPERTHAEIMNALRGCASGMRDAADRARSSASLLYGQHDPQTPETTLATGVLVRSAETGALGRVSAMLSDGTVSVRYMTDGGHGSIVTYEEWEIGSGESSRASIVPTDTDGNVWESWADAHKASEASAQSDGPGFPVACSSVHEHDAEDCAPDLGVSAYPVTSWIVSVIPDDYEGDPDAWAGSVLSTPSVTAFLDMLRDAGLTVTTDGMDGEITYASAICPTGYIRLRRPNPGEIGAARTPAQVEQDAIDAEAYRDLREFLRVSMDDPDAWDGEESEVWILASYVRWLAAGRPVDEDGRPIRRETYPTPEPSPRGGIGEDTAAFLERQNRALEAFRSGITQGIHMNRDKAKGMGPDAKTSAGAVVEFLSDLLKQAEREYDRQMKL